MTGSSLIVLDAPTILAIATLVTSCAAAAVSIVGLVRIGHTQANVQKIEIATNSMKDALVKKTEEEAHARGNLEGRADQLVEQGAAALADQTRGVTLQVKDEGIILPVKKG